jgi:hypothetical protein
MILRFKVKERKKRVGKWVDGRVIEFTIFPLLNLKYHGKANLLRILYFGFFV